MPVCTRCGAWNQDAAKRCEKCEAALTPVTPVGVKVAPQPAMSTILEPTAGKDPAEGRRRKFFQFAALLVISLVAAILLGRSSDGKYDSQGPGTLNTDYTVETSTRNGSVESVKYAVTYKFTVKDKEYTGKDKVSTEPTTADTTVFYMAENPRENGLGPSRSITINVIAAVVAFVIAIVAYCLLPKNCPLGVISAGVGDSGSEPQRMKHGKYSAWYHVHAAFVLEVALIGILIALGLAAAAHTGWTDYVNLGVGAFVAAAATLWIWADRWSCVEAFSSRSCSGLANLSFFYVPVVAFVYANYRGVRKLQGR
jgi:hypothetical protein